MDNYLEMTIVVDGQSLSVRDSLPSMLRCSHGTMSRMGALQSTVTSLLLRLCELLTGRSKDSGAVWYGITPESSTEKRCVCCSTMIGLGEK